MRTPPHKIAGRVERFQAVYGIADGLADKYPAGAHVTVRYDPNDPVTAVLDTSDEIVWDDAWPSTRPSTWPMWFLLAGPFIMGV
jgi:hypothetical protein